MTTFEKTLKDHSSEIKDFDDFGKFCRGFGFQADLVDEQRERGLFLPDIGRKVWRVTDKRSGEGMGLFAVDYIEENFGYGVSLRQTPPFRVKEVYGMKLITKYERVE